MLQIQKYIQENKRSIKKSLRKNLTALQNTLTLLKTPIFNKKMLISISIALFCFVIIKDFAWASSGETAGTTPVTDTMNGTIELLNGLVGLISIAAQPLVMFVGWLLSPDWTFGDIIGLRPVLHNIWIMVANFVYVIFALMLVFIAFMNILSNEKTGQFAMKQALPKLIGGILLVPFTWFIVSSILSVSNILTASVIGLAYDSIKQSQNGTIILDTYFIIPKQITLNLTDDSDYGSGSKKEQSYTKQGYEDAIGKTSNCGKGDDSSSCLSLGQVLGNSKGAYNLLTYYAYNIFHIDKLKNISQDEAGKSINKVGDIFKKLTFGLFFALVFSVLVVAIAFALFSRMTMLWIMAMFSPVFALTYFLGGKGGESLKKLEDNLSIKKFISLAMVPVYVSAALAFGLVFLSFAMNLKENTSTMSSIVGLEPASNGDQSITFGNGPDKQVKLTIIGNYGDGVGIADGIFSTGAGFISNVIISILALVILWMAVMAALSADKITGAAVKPIAEFGDSIGKLAMSAPKYIPLKIPGSSGKGMSMEGLKSMGGNIERAISSAASVEGGQIGTKFGEGIASSLGYHVDEWYKKSRNNLDINPGTNKPDQAIWLSNGIKALDIKDLSDLAKDNKKQEMFIHHIEKLNIDPELKKKILADIKIGDIDNLRKGFHNLDIALDGRLGKRGTEDLKGNKEVNEFLKDLHESKIEKVGPQKVELKSGEKVGVKDSTKDYTISVLIDDEPTDIKLEKNTILNNSSIILDGDDKSQLNGLIEGMDEKKAKEVLEKIFDKSKINIDKLYEALK